MESSIIIGGVLDLPQYSVSPSMALAQREFPLRSRAAPVETDFTVMPPLQQIGGTCYAYAVARLCELAGYKGASPAWINYHTLALDAHTEKCDMRKEGSYACSAIASVLYYGVCARDKMRDAKKEQRKPPNVEARKQGHASMRLFAASGGISVPCVITSFVYEEVMTYVHGASPPLAKQGAVIGSHVWVYLGKDHTGQHVIQSSWGTWGGPQGIAYITEDYLHSSWDQWSLRMLARKNG